MSKTIRIAPVRKSVVVDAAPARAFEAFTAGIDRWWPKGHTLAASPLRESIIEPFVGGRWYTKHADGSECVVGHVRVWLPGERLVVGWEINGEWKPDARVEFTSEVEVRFTAEGAGRTRVDLEHRNFERMESGGDTMREGVDNGWPAILADFAAATAA
jgi:uncharacterized protein YndB with AHSA1/START domain